MSETATALIKTINQSKNGLSRKANGGAVGTSGGLGRSGTSGTSGRSGKSGTSGTSGRSGTSGTSGMLNNGALWMICPLISAFGSLSN
ncbi:MAG: hypothetical protein FJZ87_02565 [Chloroflexi bacterium]|nr:hypothetical protein [Chloroflexota bacterium]